ncbi:GDP-mannose 4,6-dehydratase [Thermoflexus sp.]|uniref:GDP-mannose 4,6-dehydratase n=1 Tax=Thermoflexus sp. TaxID=1969742 RepID=UPI0025D934F2|nr:GDP-mannose 4,6-dehydratase [Thermoflexus sp.]MDW8181484.1 GDP-mannose 4,6-dehydratase [Anaerolineae bacterium]MCS6965044.1 GDP-mannose 4,6-dehydratase [Thermoflexus sp.]MCS7352025.1 GDP-mannose 4,6-dehydratase [Thermoflexus sp.]MCX7689271.1 GDP-mannose 4,6-dehydratase [Thermoflexus sp.]MDW8186009.1 GDP-mannose 4,6-dehydratase [Anaerolineae bacterium]
MRLLITGVGGFVGRHLAHILDQETDWELWGWARRPVTGFPDRLRLAQVDLRDPEAVRQGLAVVRPEGIIHLAAQSDVAESWRDPWGTFETNVRGTLNLLDGIRGLGLRPRVLIVTSNEVYGLIRPEDVPVREDHPFRPANPYGVSKAAQDWLAALYATAYALPIIRARPFNHIGPGQDPRFAVPSFARQIAWIEAGLQEPVIRVGNLEAQRDFTDVRDVARAYRLLLERGEPGEVYNIGSGQPRPIREVLERLLAMARVNVRVEVDPQRIRPLEIPISAADTARIRERLGWEPRIPLEQSLWDVLEEWRTWARQERERQSP